MCKVAFFVHLVNHFHNHFTDLSSKEETGVDDDVTLNRALRCQERLVFVEIGTNIGLHCTTLDCTALHCTALHWTNLSLSLFFFTVTLQHTEQLVR